MQMNDCDWVGVSVFAGETLGQRVSEEVSASPRTTKAAAGEHALVRVTVSTMGVRPCTHPPTPLGRWEIDHARSVRYTTQPNTPKHPTAWAPV